jgi:hypothetical protein
MPNRISEGNGQKAKNSIEYKEKIHIANNPMKIFLMSSGKCKLKQ